MEILSNLSVRDLMVGGPVIVPPEKSVQDVVYLMNQRRIGAVLVGDSGRIVGIFTERDLLRHAGEAELEGRPVSDWMTRNPTTIQSDAVWEDASLLMEKLHVRHLPVVDDNCIVGMLSARDLMARRGEVLNQLVEQRTHELRDAYEKLQKHDAELNLHMKVAGRLQSRLLPDRPPQWGGITWGIHYEPLDPLGGDYYDFAQIDENHLGVFVADASGHSIPAAMVTIMAQTAFGLASRQSLHPGDVLRAINKYLYGLTEEHFMTAFYGIFDLRARKLRFANAGHPYPLQLHHRTRSITRLQAQGLLLGIMPDASYEPAEAAVEPGDIFLLFTDGVIECESPKLGAYGNEKVEEFMLDSSDQSAHSIATRLADALAEFRAGGPVHDDVTALAAVVS